MGDRIFFGLYNSTRGDAAHEGRFIMASAANAITLALDALTSGQKSQVEALEKSTGVAVSLELLENIVADAIGKNLSGIPFLTYVMEQTGSWGKYGVEAISIAGAPKLMKELGRIGREKGIDPKTMGLIELFGTDLIEAVTRGAVNASDPAARRNKIAEIATRVAIRASNAFRDYAMFVHLRQLDQAGNPLPADQHGYYSACSVWQTTVGGWVASHPAQTHNSGGGKGQQARTYTDPAPKMSVVDGEYMDLIATGGHKCPACLRLSGGTEADRKVLTFWEKAMANPEVVDVLDAVVRDVSAGNRPEIGVDWLEEIAEKCDFNAILVPSRKIHPRLVLVRGMTGKYLGIYPSDVKYFFSWIKAFGGAKLTSLHAAEETAHNVLAELKHAFDHRGKGDGMSLFRKALGAFFIAVVFYMAVWPIATLGIWGLGAFGSFQNPGWNVALGMIGTLSLILWVTFWYSEAGVKKAFGGILHPHIDEHGTPSLANTARNITALFVGATVVSLLEIDIFEICLGIDSQVIRLVTVPGVMLAAIAYDRTAAAWHGSAKINALREKLSFGTVWQLSAIGTLTFLLAIPIGVHGYNAANTTFPVVVESAVVDGKTVFFVPTPNGGAFRLNKVVGRMQADKIEAGMRTAQAPANDSLVTVAQEGDYESSAELCLPKGMPLNLPGYSELIATYGKGEKDSAGKDLAGTEIPCNDGAGRNWVIRTNVFGRKYDDGVTEYSSLDELRASIDAEAPVIEVATQDGEKTTTKGSETSAKSTMESQPAADIPVHQATVATTESHEDFCKRQAGRTYHTRHLLGCD